MIRDSILLEYDNDLFPLSFNVELFTFVYVLLKLDESTTILFFLDRSFLGPGFFSFILSEMQW